MSKCPIWNEECPGECMEGRNDIPPRMSIQLTGFPAMNCRRAGIYSYSRNANVQGMTACLDEGAKVRLCAKIAYQNIVHQSPLLLDDALIRRVQSESTPLMPERLDLALEWLVRRSPKIGVTPLRNQNKISSFLAFCYCDVELESLHAVEAEMILDALKGEGLVTFYKTLSRDHVEFGFGIDSAHSAAKVTHKGYARYQELKGKSVDSSQAFVAMWFDSSMDAVYNEAIAPAIRDAGYEPVRVDNVQHNRKIDDEIIALIRRSRFIVADFTAGKPEEPRGGVYYEAGFAYGLGREVIYTCQYDFKGALHFDTRQYNHILWEKDKLSDFRQNLQNRIEATIGRGPKMKDDAE